MIAVIGSPIGRPVDGAMAAGGTASRIALAAARKGGTVQLVGKTGDDTTGDEVVLDLAKGGVGHVALLRESARATPVEPPLDDEAATAALLDADDTGSAASVDPIASAAIDGPALDAADVDLGLRYLTEFGVVVMAEPAATDVVAVVSDAARWAEARMILVVASGSSVPEGLPADVIVFEAPDADPDGAFADVVGSFAAALDEGVEPGPAFQASIGTDGWTGVEDD